MSIAILQQTSAELATLATSQPCVGISSSGQPMCEPYSLAGKVSIITGAVGNLGKSAVLRLTESLADELKSSNINVNCIMPGTIDTPQNRTAIPNGDFSKWVELDAIADVIAFLASDASRAMNGAALPVFGKA
jgi:NAD(P)-dependent dehydrogenase (short-subunit alcohol dehydrogenase family)